jgi:hypothetical protein
MSLQDLTLPLLLHCYCATAVAWISGSDQKWTAPGTDIINRALLFFLQSAYFFFAGFFAAFFFLAAISFSLFKR